ncbi:FMN-dependent NADH-azoreductase, partial [Marinitenerispora sediminis]
MQLHRLPLPRGVQLARGRAGRDAGVVDVRQRVAMELQDLLIGELEAADAYLFSVPMYNWSVPSA